MSISLDTYRSRIGVFRFSYQKKSKQSATLDNIGISIPKRKQGCYNFLLIISLICLVLPSWTTDQNSVKQKLKASKSGRIVNYISYFEDHNFNARYKYGNKQKGLKLLHWNKGSAILENKINEIEAIIQDYQPHILGMSEANYFKKNDVSN